MISSNFHSFDSRSQAGVSRSATIITAYLMYSQKLRLKKAFALVRRARPQVLPNMGFRKQLDEYDKELFGNKPDTGGDADADNIIPDEVENEQQSSPKQLTSLP